MGYDVKYRAGAKKALEKIDRPAREMIKNWIAGHLDGCENPRAYGRAMTGNHGGEWRYRVGVYRILAEIHDDEVLIMVIDIGHRQGVYNKKRY